MRDIKLVATDMDGTLLNSKGELSDAFYPILRKLRANGIYFAAASGRQFFNLEKRLERVKEEVIFVAENGSYVVYQGREMLAQPLENDTVNELLTIARRIPNAYPIFCGKKKAYVESTDPALFIEFTKYFERYEVVDDLLKVTDDPCLKVTVCDLGGSATNSYPYFEDKAGHLKVKVSGHIWLDISHQLADKGRALSVIQQTYGITPAQTMAFGDYLNDLEMLQQARYSDAMANAHPDIQRIARFKAKSNDEEGVLEILREG